MMMIQNNIESDNNHNNHNHNNVVSDVDVGNNDLAGVIDDGDDNFEKEVEEENVIDELQQQEEEEDIEENNVISVPVVDSCDNDVVVEEEEEDNDELNHLIDHLFISSNHNSSNNNTLYDTNINANTTTTTTSTSTMSNTGILTPPVSSSLPSTTILESESNILSATLQCPLQILSSLPVPSSLTAEEVIADVTVPQMTASTTNTGTTSSTTTSTSGMDDDIFDVLIQQLDDTYISTTATTTTTTTTNTEQQHPSLLDTVNANNNDTTTMNDDDHDVLLYEPSDIAIPSTGIVWKDTIINDNNTTNNNTGDICNIYDGDYNDDYDGMDPLWMKLLQDDDIYSIEEDQQQQQQQYEVDETNHIDDDKYEYDAYNKNCFDGNIITNHNVTNMIDHNNSNDDPMNHNIIMNTNNNNTTTTSSTINSTLNNIPIGLETHNNNNNNNSNDHDNRNNNNSSNDNDDNNDDNNANDDDDNNNNNDNNIATTTSFEIYCQLCNDPNSIIPLSISFLENIHYYNNNNQNNNETSIYNNDELAWLYATQAVYYNEQIKNKTNTNNDNDTNLVLLDHEQQQQMDEDERLNEEIFWKEQYQILLQYGQYNNNNNNNNSNTNNSNNIDNNVELWNGPYTEDQFHLNEFNTDPNNIITQSADASSISEAIPNQNDQLDRQQHQDYSPEIITLALPYVSAFQSTFCNETKDIRQSLLEYENKLQQQNIKSKQQQRECYGHNERILGCDISLDNKYIATASQDSTIRIWNIYTNKCIHTMKHHNVQYECLRVTWSDTDHWGNIDQFIIPSITTDPPNDISSSVSQSMYLLATGGADGIVYVFGCMNPDKINASWIKYATLDHSTYNHILHKKLQSQQMKAKTTKLEGISEADDEDEDDGYNDVEGSNKNYKDVPEIDHTPQIYALQFIDHWDALPNIDTDNTTTATSTTSTTTTVLNNKQNSFLLTSSEDYIHIWEIIPNGLIDEHERCTTSTYIPKKVKVQDSTATTGTTNNTTSTNDASINDEMSMGNNSSRNNQNIVEFDEVMSIHFGPITGPAYGVQIGSVTRHDHTFMNHTSSCPNNTTNNNNTIHQSDSTSNNTRFTFGGERNPDNIIYVFDASYCSANGILGVALSDGTLRLMNGRGVCLSVLQLPGGQQSHLTSFQWDKTGQRLVTTVATGHLVIWNIELINPLGVIGYNDPQYSHSLVSSGIRTSCCAVLDGGHIRPSYGCTFIENDQLLISYGSDGRICLWDSNSSGEIYEPLAILWENNYNVTSSSEGYPIFSLAIATHSTASRMNIDGITKTDKGDDDNKLTSVTMMDVKSDTTSPKSTSLSSSSPSSTTTIVIAGGGSQPGGILGVPVYLQDIYLL